MEPGRINVNGLGVATAEPDICTLTISVTTQEKRSNASRKSNNESMNKVRNGLRQEFDIEAKDLKTFGMNVRP